MNRMKTFFIYVLLIVGFFALSILLENGLLLAMYSKISGEFDVYYAKENSYFAIQNASAKACNINGYINFDLINTTEKFIDKCYLKLDLYNEMKLLADTEYIEIRGMHAGDTRKISTKFKANNIEKFSVSIVENTPDKTNIIDILGWEIDLTNVFGLGIDLSNTTIFGTKLVDMFNPKNLITNLKTIGSNFYNWFIITANGVPLWAYLVGLVIIIL